MIVSAIPFPAVLDPVAFEVGPVVVRWYALAYIAAFLLGWRYCTVLAKRDPAPPNATHIDAFLTWAVIGVILGGRLGFLLFYRPDLLLEPGRALALWQGGMAFHGGALGVMAAVFLFSWRHRVNPLRLGDIICCAAPIGLFLGRIANFINGELWGRPTDLPWGVVFPIPPAYGDLFPEVARHPSQLYEAVLEGLVLFVVLYLLARHHDIRNRPGFLSGVFFAGYGLGRFLVEFVREPDAGSPLYFDLFSQGQALSAPMILFGLWLMARARRRPPDMADAAA